MKIACVGGGPAVCTCPSCITDPDHPEVAGADFVVAADGVNSALCASRAPHFGSRVRTGRNRCVWLGPP